MLESFIAQCSGCEKVKLKKNLSKRVCLIGDNNTGTCFCRAYFCRACKKTVDEMLDKRIDDRTICRVDLIREGQTITLFGEMPEEGADDEITDNKKT